MSKTPVKIISVNKKARFDFHLSDDFEAGMVLLGTEVKALRMGKVNLKDSYARIKNGEVYLHQMHIGEYPFAYYGNHDPLRPRKLLLHKYEIKRLIGKTKERGYSLIPTRIYFKNGRVKINVSLAKGKQKADKRETIKRRDEKREMDRARKGQY